MFAPIPQSIGNLSSYHKISGGIRGKASDILFRVLVYTPQTIRVTFTKNADFTDFSYAVISQPGEASFQLDETGEQLAISTNQLTLRVQKNPLRFCFETPEGEVLNNDDPMGTQWAGNEVSVYKSLQEGERFIGLGEKGGNLDRFGSGYTHYNTDAFGYNDETDPLYVTIPFYIGVHHGLSYGIFMDNSCKSHFNFGASNNRFASFSTEAGDMDYYFMAGSVSDIVGEYTALTGRITLPPKWSIGYQQCRYSYYPDTDVLTLARQFREKNIPADAIVLDIHYMDEYKIFTWNKHRFPKPDEMLAALKEMGFRTIVIVDPGIKVEEGYAWYEEGKQEGVFVKYPDDTDYTGQVWPGWCHFPDFTNPEGRKWWGDSFKGYVENGVEGFWNDMNEIATWGQRLPENLVFDFEGNKTTTKQARNVYGMQMARSTYEGARSLMNGKRPFILTRAAYAGAQRYTAIWTGDNTASNEHMLLGVRLLNSLGLSGVPFVGYDVGGFVGDADVRLYTRWITIGAFSPFFRGHSNVNTRSSEPWSYGEEAEEIAANYIRLRYRLMPYLYSLFFQAMQTGMPVQRTLALEYTHDDTIYNERYQNQYLFGPFMLVAPSESTRELTKVYLPKGEWYYFFNGEAFRGKHEIIAESPVKRLPVYVKGGAIIPMQQPLAHTGEAPEGPLEVHVYQGEEATDFMYYEDDGTTYEYEKGNYYQRNIAYLPRERELCFSEKTGNLASAFSEIKLVLHGFNGMNRIDVNRQIVQIKEEEITFLTPISAFDPQGAAEVISGEVVSTVVLANQDEAITVKW